MTTYAENMAIATPDASNITTVVLTGLGSVTHTLDMDQRYVELAFTRNGGGLVAQAPPSASLIPTWLLHAVAGQLERGAVGGEDRQARRRLGNSPAAGRRPGHAVGANVFGSAVQVAALAASSVGISQVQVYLDDQPLGAPLTTAPYVVSWDTTRVANGSHRLLARTTDSYGVLSTSAAVSVNVLNIAPPVLSLVGASNVTQTGALINWTTDEPTIGMVQFGTAAPLASTTPSEVTFAVNHAATLSGLAPDTVYFCEVVTTNALAAVPSRASSASRRWRSHRHHPPAQRRRWRAVAVVVVAAVAVVAVVAAVAPGGRRWWRWSPAAAAAPLAPGPLDNCRPAGGDRAADSGCWRPGGCTPPAAGPPR